jgi:hypothetical protein
MWENFSYLPKDETTPLPTGEWFYELSWYLSQRYYYIQYDGVDYILYLRGRWKHLWQAYVIRNADSLGAINESPAVWSVDIFRLHHIHCNAEDLELAKAIMISLFYEFNGQFPELRTVLRKLE